TRSSYPPPRRLGGQADAVNHRIDPGVERVAEGAAGHQGAAHHDEGSGRPDQPFDGPGPGPPARGGRPEAEEAARALAGGEVLHRAVDHAAVDAPLLLRVAEEQTVVAGEVHETRHALRPLRDALDGALAEDAEVTGAGDPQSGPDELARLLDIEQRDA